MDTPKEQMTKGTWSQVKGRLKEAWGTLTDDDLDRYEGKRDQLEGYLQQKTGEGRDDIRKKLDRYSDDLKYRW